MYSYVDLGLSPWGRHSFRKPSVAARPGLETIRFLGSRLQATPQTYSYRMPSLCLQLRFPASKCFLWLPGPGWEPSSPQAQQSLTISNPSGRTGSRTGSRTPYLWGGIDRPISVGRHRQAHICGEACTGPYLREAQTGPYLRGGLDRPICLESHRQAHICGEAWAGIPGIPEIAGILFMCPRPRETGSLCFNMYSYICLHSYIVSCILTRVLSKSSC